MPVKFDHLDAFLSRCERAVAVHGEAALVCCGYTHKTDRDTLRLGRKGPLMRVIGWDVEAGLTVCEVNAQEAINAAARGEIVEGQP